MLIKKGRYWSDPRSVVPLLMAITLVEEQRDARCRLIRSVVDCRDRTVTAALADVFRLPVPFVAHFAQAELFCLWTLGLPTPDQLWDTCVAERAFLLGRHHYRYLAKGEPDEDEEVGARAEAKDRKTHECSLETTCLRRGVPLRFAAEKKRLQRSFLDHPDGKPFSTEHIEYAAEDAVVAAELYFIQVEQAVKENCFNHLITVEMPWVVTNSRCIWDGVRIDPGKCGQLRMPCRRHQVGLAGELKDMGLNNANSHDQIEAFFARCGLLELFRVQKKYSFNDKALEAAEDRHPAIPLIRASRKVARLLNDKTFTGELIGADGRLHPSHRQLGAESGRNSMQDPNLGGLGRALRPIIVPAPGFGIGEVDLSQIEVGIAAAYFNDPALIRMFNGRDVYTAMMCEFYANDLTPGELALSDKTLKKRYPHLRDMMKVCTLAIIYNISPFGLSVQLGVTVQEAEQLQQRFLGMFPKLTTALREASQYGIIRGFAYVCSGLRRWRARPGAASNWEVNWMRNTPVQGSAAVVFKVAGNRLYRRYQHLRRRAHPADARCLRL